MNELRDSVLSVGVADPEAAIGVHALLGSDPALLAQAGELPTHLGAVGPWVKTNFLRPDSPFFEAAAGSVAAELGAEPDERADKILRQTTVRPRVLADLRATTGFELADIKAVLADLAEAGLVRADPNPLDPEDPFWTINHRLARFHYTMLADHLPRWRRGYITDKLWRMTHARLDRYVCRPEFTALAREWALRDPAATEVTRVVVPDPHFKQLRTLEVAAWGEKGEPAALGTVRWMFRMRHLQLKRLRYVARLLTDQPVRLYCIAPKVEPVIAVDEDPNLFRIGPSHLLSLD